MCHIMLSKYLLKLLKFSCTRKTHFPAMYVNAYRGSARQCCYGNMGELLDGTRGGGTSDFLSPFSDANSPHLVQLLHFESDVIPFLDCCKTQESLCLEYHKFRPSTMGSCEHNKPIPGIYTCTTLIIILLLYGDSFCIHAYYIHGTKRDP